MRRSATIILIYLLTTSSPIYANDSSPQFQCYASDHYKDFSDFKAQLYQKNKEKWPEGVFQHTGGGPNGSHWNFSGMSSGVYCALKVPFQYKAEDKIDLIITGKKIDEIKFYPLPEDIMIKDKWYFFKIPFELLRKSTKKIKRSDLLMLYSDQTEAIDLYLTKGKWFGAAPPKYGEIVEISVSLNNNKLILMGLIHLSYGE